MRDTDVAPFVCPFFVVNWYSKKMVSCILEYAMVQ